MTWVKICGNTSLQDALAAVEAGADAVGLIFALSPRQVTIEVARAISTELPPQIDRVGVFVNESVSRIRQIVEGVGLTVVQLHGDETAEFVRNLAGCGATGAHARRKWRLLRAVSLAPDAPSGLRCLDGAEDMLDGVLLDSGAGTLRGGTGQVFDWRAGSDLVFNLGQRFRLVVAGGLSPNNVAQAVALFHPWGVDVCSGVEQSPGRKDVAKVREFVAAVRQAEQAP